MPTKLPDGSSPFCTVSNVTATPPRPPHPSAWLPSPTAPAPTGAGTMANVAPSPPPFVPPSTVTSNSACNARGSTTPGQNDEAVNDGADGVSTSVAPSRVADPFVVH